MRAPGFRSVPFVIVSLAVSLSVSVFLPTSPAFAAESDELRCATLDIDRIGTDALVEMEASLDPWLEMDDVLFACGSESELATFSSRIVRSWTDLSPDDLFVVRAAHPGREGSPEGLSFLARGGPYSVVKPTTTAARNDLLADVWPGHRHDDSLAGTHDGCKAPAIETFAGSRVLARQSANASRFGGGTVFDPAVADAVGAVDFDRWYAAAEILASWNRYTHGSEVGDASAWLVSQFSALGLPVETPIFEVGGTAANNVIATWTGTARPNDWFVVGGHYDSISPNPFVSAPGAEDNASGCAGVLELARVLVPRQPESTIIFVCYSGEEQGLFGSDDHAGGLVADGDADKIVEVQTMDMIGYTGDADLDVLLETEPEFASILDLYVDAAEAFTSLRTVTSLNAFGSDHVPFLNRGIAALLTIENDWASYPGYHSTTDLPANLDLQMGGQILQMNAAVLAHRAGLEGAGEIFADGFQSGTTSAWSLTVP